MGRKRTLVLLPNDPASPAKAGARSKPLSCAGLADVQSRTPQSAQAESGPRPSPGRSGLGILEACGTSMRHGVVGASASPRQAGLFPPPLGDIPASVPAKTTPWRRDRRAHPKSTHHAENPVHTSPCPVAGEGVQLATECAAGVIEREALVVAFGPPSRRIRTGSLKHRDESRTARGISAPGAG